MQLPSAGDAPNRGRRKRPLRARLRLKCAKVVGKHAEASPIIWRAFPERPMGCAHRMLRAAAHACKSSWSRRLCGRAVPARCGCQRRTPKGAWRSCAAAYHHTAQQLGPARIAYQFHPFFEREVRVVRRLKVQESPGVVVELQEGLRIATPCWMLDEVCCQAMRLEERPRIAVDALRLLRGLVDLQAASSGEQDLGCGLMAAKGGCHEPTISGSRADAGTASASTET